MSVKGFMAAKVVQLPSLCCRVLPATPIGIKMIQTNRAVPASNLRTKSSGIGEFPSGLRPSRSIKAAEQGPSLVSEEQGTQETSGAYNMVSQIKADLKQAIEGTNRGIFGVPSAKKSEISVLVELLESQNPTLNPTQHLDKVGGCWKLVYSTISILGSKRTKLGLRDFISLDDFFQTIYPAQCKAVNTVEFSLRGLNVLKGQLTIEASFKVASETRVDIKYENSIITPDQLMSIFRKNYDLLLSIFNPEGWLEISYVDESMRIGRDDKGNVFILERSEREGVMTTVTTNSRMRGLQSKHDSISLWVQNNEKPGKVLFCKLQHLNCQSELHSAKNFQIEKKNWQHCASTSPL